MNFITFQFLQKVPNYFFLQIHLPSRRVPHVKLKLGRVMMSFFTVMQLASQNQLFPGINIPTVVKKKVTSFF